jgi:hypothetical protein
VLSKCNLHCCAEVLRRLYAAEARAEEAETRLEATRRDKDGAVGRVKALEGDAKVAKERIDDLIREVTEAQERVRTTEGTLEAAREASARWGCTSRMQLTHSLKAPGFKPSNLKCDMLVSRFAFTCNLYRCSEGRGGGEGGGGGRGGERKNRRRRARNPRGETPQRHRPAAHRAADDAG